jgi:hypothetical protein
MDSKKRNNGNLFKKEKFAFRIHLNSFVNRSITKDPLFSEEEFILVVVVYLL